VSNEAISPAYQWSNTIIMSLFFFFFLLHAQKALLADSKSFFFFFFFFNLEKIIKNSLFPFPFLNYNAIQNSGITLAFFILLKNK
jgi:hypothetical protein